jgi:hypothetical protein
VPQISPFHFEPIAAAQSEPGSVSVRVVRGFGALPAQLAFAGVGIVTRDAVL